MKNSNQFSLPAVVARGVCESPQISTMSKAIDCVVVATFLAQAAVYREMTILEMVAKNGGEPIAGSKFPAVQKKMELLFGFESSMRNGLPLFDALILCREKAVRLGISIGDFDGVAL